MTLADQIYRILSEFFASYSIVKEPSGPDLRDPAASLSYNQKPTTRIPHAHRSTAPHNDRARTFATQFFNASTCIYGTTNSNVTI